MAPLEKPPTSFSSPSLALLLAVKDAKENGKQLEGKAADIEAVFRNVKKLLDGLGKAYIMTIDDLSEK
jgi:hypothetical protein